jgi:hypothetical protein
MMETLGQKQERFCLAVAKLIVATFETLGYKLRLGEGLRSDEQAEINAIGAEGRAQLSQELMTHWPVLAAKIANNTGSGIRNSLHEVKLAQDLNLFVDGKWISNGESPHWLKVGELWESMGADHRWGGRFKDANHVSIEHEGRK